MSGYQMQGGEWVESNGGSAAWVPERKSPKESGAVSTPKGNTPDTKMGKTLARVIVGAGGVVMAAVFIGNIGPYSSFATQVMAGSWSRIPLLGGFFLASAQVGGLVLGTASLLIVQGLEVLPQLLPGLPFKVYRWLKSAALMAYAVDVVASLWFWNPLNVPVWELFVRFNLFTSVNWFHVIMIVLTVKGGSWWVSAWQNLRNVK